MAGNNKRDYYEVLGVEKNANIDEIKKAYRKAAMANHPDRNQGDKAAEERFKEATEAYEILSDEKKRSLYDQFGFAGVDQAGGAGNYSNTYRDFSDLFGGGGFGSAFEDIIGSFFGGSRGGFSGGSAYYGGGAQGSSLKYQVEIDLKDAINGTKVDISFSHLVKCQTCDGTGAKKGTSRKTCPTCGGSGRTVHSSGFFQMATTCSTCRGAGTILESPCPECQGDGVVKRKEKITVDIPSGISSGTRIRLQGLGDAAPNNGTPGDLYVYVNVKEDKKFKREGNDLYCQLPISIIQATLGGKVELECIDGDVISIDIPQGSETGKVLRVKGKGANPNGAKIGPFSNKGDLFVRLYVETPTKLSGKAKELFESLKDEIESEKRPKLMNFD